MFDYVSALYGLYAPEKKFEGQGMVEYALILALVSVVAIIALTTLGGKLGPLFDSISGKLNPAS